MALSVNTNVMSLTAQRNLSSTQTGLATAMERLSSGLRVNSAKDDAAGLAIASRMDAQTRGMNVAIRNAGDAISLAQTAEGGLNEITNMLQRMRELAVQSANATNSASDRLNLDAEYQALNTEITRQVDATMFNGVAIIGGGAGANVFQVGPNATAADTITVTTTTMAAAAPGTDITTDVLATAAIGLVDTALDLVTTNRATYGAVQNRFQSVINNLQVASENQAAARGRIMDADFAQETANMTRFQILQQAGTAMVAQANAAPQSVLSLLQ
ncbi:MAG: flagellin [Pseudomonadota bacterium]|nr:flagellin [Pseudomonadota bacterium]